MRVPRFSRSALWAAGAVLLLVFLLAAGMAIKASPAQAQHVMAAPGCQCSAPTSVLGTGGGPKLVHCVCGGLSCAISMAAGNSSDNHQLQCMK